MTAGATGQARVSRLDRMIDALDGFVPKPAAWAFALRIWLAMMLALYAAFWLQLSSASSAATCAAILAQPKRGQAISKAVYRILGTVIGGIVAIVLMGAFAQDRVLLFVAFAVWIGLCVFVAQYLQDTRAYGAMLSGYTVAIIAFGNLETPQSTFDSALGRMAAIIVGIVSITFINDALASPSTWRSLRPQLASILAEARAFVRAALTRNEPDAEQTAALIGRIAPMRADASAIAGELDDGRNRAAGARSAIAALYAMAAAARLFAEARAGIAPPSPSVEEARRICLRAASEDGADCDAATLKRDGARLCALVDEAVADGTRALPEIVALQRALDLHDSIAFADDGLRALGDGHKPLRDVRLPTHRDFPVALRAAVRVAVTFGIAGGLFVASGQPQTSFALVQIAATCALSSVTPDPIKFAVGVLFGMPLAALFAGLILFGALDGNQGFPLLAIAMAPAVFLGCFLSLNPKTFTVGFITLVFTSVLVSPSNPQVYNPQTFLMNACLVVVSSMVLYLAVRLVLPISKAQRRLYAFEEARRDTADAMAGAGGDATTRTSLNSDRLFQFTQWNSGSGAVRRASLNHAFALARLEAAAARAHVQTRILGSLPGLHAVLDEARAALRRGSARDLDAAALALIGAVGGEAKDIRLRAARAATDLATSAQVVRRHGRFLRRLGIPAA